ncbi:hypothetical protein RMS29_015460 [Agrobacterium rosae]|uniref:Uncharacterized protein n=1 Tax=Agrobacterium rosae TaxID=1972867 RepID=A0ABU4W556_9HYPH|nr:hypothetical protein [Agrobacterium rosae]MDX8332919.1 hypothetical protein [Agrobacterium rosae]
MKNGLLDALSPEDQLLIRPFLKSVELSLKQTLDEVSQPIEFVYFFQSGLLSEVATANGLGKLEVGCIGRCSAAIMMRRWRQSG